MSGQQRERRRRRGKEGGSERGREREGGAGDYTIIQITAGYNLVADVSRSTMPTTHRRVCVCAYTLKTSFNAQRAATEREGERKKPAADESSTL